MLTYTSTVSVPAPIQNAIASHSQQSAISASLSSFSSPPRISNFPAKNRDSIQRRQLWWLPYVVLEFDKNEVLVDALGGDLSSPVWMYSATFDVSRISDIAITPYLRQTQPSSSAVEDGNGRGNGNGGAGADMGNSNLCLGTLRFVPDLEANVSSPLHQKSVRH